MTVASKIKQTLSTLKGVKSTIGTFAMHHPDQTTKNEFYACEKKVDMMIRGIEERVQQIEFEEPQFKGY